MSVKHALLALLSRGPSTTYQLKKDFDHTTGQTWPLNIGQVSTTLQRLARDELVQRDDVGDSGADPWQLTAAGRLELEDWWSRPVDREQRGRDELIMKLALAVETPGVDVTVLVQRQRSAMQQVLHDVTRVRRAVAQEDLAARLVLDSHIFTTEAELRWLDAVEGEVEKARMLPASTSPATSATVVPVPAKSIR